MRDTYSLSDAEAIVSDLKASDKVLRLSKIGAVPYLRHNPYTNNDGVKVYQWDCISYHFEAFPGKSLLSYPHVIMPQNEDTWEINLITDEWVKAALMRHRENDIEILEFDKSPFAGNVIDDWD